MQAIKNLKTGKSPGIDGLNIQFYKSCADQLAPFLTRLFNFYFEHAFFPAEWSKSLLCPIHKKGNINDPNNYRGFSLLTEISMIFTSIINKRLKTWVETKEIIGEEQAGFREQNTTIDQLFCLYTIINKFLRHKGGGGDFMHCLSTLRRSLTVLTALHFGKNYYLKMSVQKW